MTHAPSLIRSSEPHLTAPYLALSRLHLMNCRYHQLVNEIQSELYAFICSLLCGGKDVNDVLQETNVVLWEKAKEYDPDREFRPWAYQIAYFQVMAFRKRQQRERLVFDDSLVESLSSQLPQQTQHLDSRLEALEECIQQLSESNRELVRRRYRCGESVNAIADRMGRTSGAVSVLLFRIRKTLANCVRSRISRCAS